MKRVAVAAAVATLALPASALAAARATSYNARVLRATALSLVLRRLDGATVRFSAAQIAGVATASAIPREPLAHMAGGPRSAGGGIEALDPGVVVRVTETAAPAGRPAITLGVPTGVHQTRQAAGVISAVTDGSFLLDVPGGTELRLHGRVAGLRPCQRARVVYHQDGLTLVAGQVTVTGPAGCAA